MTIGQEGTVEGTTRYFFFFFFFTEGKKGQEDEKTGRWSQY